jgi:hypothetical protein
MLNQKNLNEMSEQIHFGPVHKTGRNSAPVAKNIGGIDMMLPGIIKYQIEDDHMILHNKGHYAYLRNVEDNLVFQTFFGHNGIVRSLNYFKDLVVTGSDD